MMRGLRGTRREFLRKILYKNILYVGEGTLPWAIFRFRIFLNYSQKFEKLKITV